MSASNEPENAAQREALDLKAGITVKYSHFRGPRRAIARSMFLLWALGSANRGFSQSEGSANTNPLPELPSVTVTAPKPPAPEQLAGDSVHKFIAAHSRPAVITGQLARWHVGICPTTSGLTPGFNSFVSARIEAIAAIVGAPHQELGHCRANIQIFFTAEPEKAIDTFAKRGPVLLGFHYPRETQKQATFSHPIQGWYVTATEGDDGRIGLDEAVPIQRGTPENRMPATTPPGRLGTRLATGLNSFISNVLIIANAKKISGHTIGSISDYLAMLILSQTKSPDTCGNLPSILDLMASNCDERERPDAVTAGDLAFLHALYAVDLREQLYLEQSDILSYMMKQFSAP
jgi:hypothetical protein